MVCLLPVNCLLVNGLLACGGRVIRYGDFFSFQAFLPALWGAGDGEMEGEHFLQRDFGAEAGEGSRLADGEEAFSFFPTLVAVGFFFRNCLPLCKRSVQNFSFVNRRIKHINI